MNFSMALSLFRSLDPRIDEDIEATLDGWKNEPQGARNFSALWEISWMLMDQKTGLGKNTIISALALVERCLIEGDEDLQTAVATGMVEHFGVLIKNNDPIMHRFIDYLGRETLKYLEDFGTFTMTCSD